MKLPDSLLVRSRAFEANKLLSADSGRCVEITLVRCFVVRETRNASSPVLRQAHQRVKNLRGIEVQEAHQGQELDDVDASLSRLDVGDERLVAAESLRQVDLLHACRPARLAQNGGQALMSG